MKGKNCNHCGTVTENTAVVCDSHYRTATTYNIKLEQERAELLEALTALIAAAETRYPHFEQEPETSSARRTLDTARAVVARLE